MLLIIGTQRQWMSLFTSLRKHCSHFAVTAVMLALTLSTAWAVDPVLLPPTDSYTEGYQLPDNPRAALRLFRDDARSLFTLPLQWDQSDWKKVAVVAGFTLALTGVDTDIQKTLQKNRVDYWSPDYEKNPSDHVSKWVEPLGRTETVLSLIGAFYLYGRKFGDDRAKQTALLCTESLVMANLISIGLKVAVDRERPSGSGVHYDWGPDSDGSSSRESFPSGHTVNAFAVATVIAMQYEDRQWVPYVAYGLAGLTGLSRINDNRHWASDVFAGACIGHFVSRFLVNRHQDWRVTAYPTVSQEETSLMVHLRF